jgi:hypothetical protein
MAAWQAYTTSPILREPISGCTARGAYSRAVTGSGPAVPDDGKAITRLMQRLESNTASVRELIDTNVEATDGLISAKRLLPVVSADVYRGEEPAAGGGRGGLGSGRSARRSWLVAATEADSSTRRASWSRFVRVARPAAAGPKRGAPLAFGGSAGGWSRHRPSDHSQVSASTSSPARPRRRRRCGGPVGHPARRRGRRRRRGTRAERGARRLRWSLAAAAALATGVAREVKHG